MKYLLSVLVVLFTISLANANGSYITYSVEGAEYEGYYITPSPKAPLVLLIHDWDGLTDYEVKRAGMLADLGYAVFAVDLYGKGDRPTELNDKRNHTKSLYNDRAKMRVLIRGGLKAAAEHGANITNAVATGYCFGGAAVLELARSGEDLKGFVSFHGGLQTPEGQNYSKTQGKLLILHGTADTSVTMDMFAKLAVELENSSVQHEMITYSGAPHAFTVFGSKRYREDADHKSWKRFTEFLGEVL